MRAKKFHALKRVKIRQSWNKFNLYNITRLKSPLNISQTYFQKKWAAKAQTRAYHGETMIETHWKRMFNPQIRAAIPMDAKQLAQNDGSDQAAGRGSGLTGQGIRKNRRMRKLPYMNMVFAPTERRLDVAIFRAMFASSARQARQFCIHGFVKVNGKQMPYPAYQLNPGDMFQVDPERVMFATGAPKHEPKALRKIKSDDTADTEEADEAAALDAEPASEEASTEVAESDEALTPRNHKETLKDLLAQAKSILSSDSSASARRKRDLREFQQTIRKAMSRSGKEPTQTGDLETQLAELTSKLNISSTDAPNNESSTTTESTPGQSLTISNFEKKQLEEALAAARENPVDPSKPYATPWRPRDYMSAFAFIPRYLEVHHPICSAVYLRHPVVRPGIAEVPTPFTNEVLELTFNWYLRRR